MSLEIRECFASRGRRTASGDGGTGSSCSKRRSRPDLLLFLSVPFVFHPRPLRSAIKLARIDGAERVGHHRSLGESNSGETPSRRDSSQENLGPRRGSANVDRAPRESASSTDPVGPRPPGKPVAVGSNGVRGQRAIRERFRYARNDQRDSDYPLFFPLSRSRRPAADVPRETSVWPGFAGGQSWCPVHPGPGVADPGFYRNEDNDSVPSQFR